MEAKSNARRAAAVLARWCLCALALAHVPLSGAAGINRTNIGQAGVSRSGNSAGIQHGGVGDSSVPISPSAGGWSYANNYGVPIGATGPTVGSLNAFGFVDFRGIKYPMQTTVPLTRSAVAAAVGTVTCGIFGSVIGAVACATAMPFVLDWLTRSGGRVNPQTGQLERTVSAYQWVNNGIPSTNPLWNLGFHQSGSSACQSANVLAYLNQQVAQFPNQHIGPVSWEGGSSSGYCTADRLSTAGAPQGPLAMGIARQGVVQTNWLPSSMDDIAPYMANVAPDGRVVGEILDKGGTIQVGSPTVTGPASVQGPETTTVNPDGTRAVSRTTYNFQTSGNTITNTSNVTTNNTYNSSNVQTGTTTTTTTPTATGSTAAEDKPTECEKAPNRVGCLEADVPDGVIPKSQKTITYSEESTWGLGSCPSDKYWSPGTLHGGSYKFINWSEACGWAASLRWLVMLLGAWAAFWIVMPGNTQVKPQ